MISVEPIPAEWEQTILACLEKEMENRPSTAHAVMELLGLAAPARQPGEVPAVLPGGTTSAGFVQGQPTSHTAAYIRPGAGLTELAAPTRPLTVSRVRVAGAGAQEAPPESTGQVPTARKEAAARPRMKAVVLLGALAVLGAGGWYGFGHWKESRASGPAVVAADSPKTPEPEPGSVPSVPKEPAKDPQKVPKTASIPVPPPVPPPTPPPQQPPLPDTTINGKLARAKAGDTVTIEAGTYEEQIQFKEGVNLRAAEPGKVIVQIGGKSGSVLRVEKCASGSISGFVFQHLGTETVEGDAAPVGQLTSSSVTLEDCTFQRSVGSGLEVNGAGRPTLTRCKLANNSRLGLVLGAGTTAVVNQCVVQKNGASGIEVRHSGTAPVLTGNTASENGDSGIAVKDGAAASILENTRCALNGEAGVAAVGEGTSVTLSGAGCDGNKHGVSIQNGAIAKLTGCTIRDSKEMGVHLGLAASGSEIRDCTVEKSDVYGILLVGAAGSSPLITGNKVLNNALTGILATGEGFRPRIEKNDCIKNGEYGIGIAEGSSAIVRENTLRGNNRGGIGQQNAAKDVLIENNIVSDEDAK